MYERLLHVFDDWLDRQHHASIQTFTRRHLRLDLLGLRFRATAPESHHATHHIKQRIALSRDLDAKIHLANRRQRVVPAPDLLDVGGVMFCQLLVQIGATPLDRQQQQTEEVEERKRGIDAHIGRLAGDLLQHQRLVRGGESRGEDEVCLVRGAQIAGQEVGEDAAGAVEGSGVGAVLGVPFVFEPGEGFRGVSGAKSKMTLCLVRLRFCEKPTGLSRPCGVRNIRNGGLRLPWAYRNPAA